MRVFVILVAILLVGVGVLFFMGDDLLNGTQTASQNTDEVTIEKNTPATEATEAAETAADISKDQPIDIKAPEKLVVKPIIIEKKKTAKSMIRGILPMAPPSFDVVRVDENCGILVAGRAEPTAEIQIYAGEIVIGTTTASRRGEWVYISNDPLSPGAQQINVKAINPDGQTQETAHLVVMQVPDCSIQEEKRAPAIAMLAPKGEEKGAFDKRVSKLLQIPEPQGDLKAAKNLAVGSIDYDDKGNVALSGKGTPGNEVQVYVDNKPVGSAAVDDKGNWTLQPEKEIPAGTYNLRTDQLDKSGSVISRVEIPFQRASADDVVLARGSLEIRAIVQPGNSLWRIARRMYGDGIQYTMIYQANQSQIKNPDLIFPGQIFKLPSEKKLN